MLNHRTPTGSSAILRGNRHLSAVTVAILLATGLMASLLPGATSGAATPSGAPGIALGAYVQPAPVPGAPNAAITNLIGGIGHSLAIVQTFSDWQTTTGASVPFPTAFPRVQAALYFDAPVGSSDQVLTSSPTAFQAFAQVAALPLYQAAAPG